MSRDIYSIRTLGDLYLSYKGTLTALIQSDELATIFRTQEYEELLPHVINGVDNYSSVYAKFTEWFEDSLNSRDFHFIEKYSDRRISRTMFKFLEILDNISGSSVTLSSIAGQTVRHAYETVIPKNAENWVKKFVAYSLTEYAPLDNYNMRETRTPNLTETVSGTESITGSETINDGKSGTGSKSTKTDLTQSISSESETGIFGFNSGSTSNPTADGTGSTTTRTTGSATDNVESVTNSETITGTHSNTGSKTTGGTKTNTGTETLTRSGNIGVTTSQQMLQSELELRSQLLIDEILKALADYMTNPVY